MASTPLVLPSHPPLNFGQFLRPVADAKALLRMAAVSRRARFNDLCVNPNGVAPEVIVSALSWTDSNGGLAHQHPQISQPIRKELPCLPQGLGGPAAAHNSLSASCSEKTHNESAVHPSAAILPSAEKEIPCPHKGFKDTIAPLNSSSADSCYHSELKTRNESAMDPLAAEIDPDADAEKCSLRHNTCNSLKRARVPKLHNKSKKRRRGKINEKMRALQKLIPNAGKTDKSTILDEAIEYLKYLQFQIQFRSIQNGMDPRLLMLLTGMQEPKAYYQLPYLQQMGMSTGLMEMDMEMGFEYWPSIKSYDYHADYTWKKNSFLTTKPPYLVFD